MIARSKPKVLLAEGKDEEFTLPELLERCGIPWPRERRPIHIKQCDGIEALLDRGGVEAELKESGLQALGLVVDANGDPAARWQRIHALMTSGDAPLRPGFPEQPDPGVDGSVNPSRSDG